MPSARHDNINYRLRGQLTMQQAVLHHFPDVQSTYKFTHRDANVYFTRECYERFAASIPRAHSAFPAPAPDSYLVFRVFRLVFDARRTHLARNHVPVSQAFIPRLPCRLSLQAISGPGFLRAALARQRRGPHRDRSVRSMGRSDLLGSAPFGNPKRDLLYYSR
jgi:hypothetical protein